MPWTKTDYPVSMKNLPAKVRNKAIEIANAMLDEHKDMGEGIIIATAISRAKDWAIKNANATVTIQKRTGKVDNRISFNPKRKLQKVKSN